MDAYIELSDEKAKVYKLRFSQSYLELYSEQLPILLRVLEKYDETLPDEFSCGQEYAYGVEFRLMEKILSVYYDTGYGKIEVAFKLEDKDVTPLIRQIKNIIKYEEKYYGN